MGDYQARFCERFRGEIPLYLLDPCSQLFLLSIILVLMSSRCPEYFFVNIKVSCSKTFGMKSTFLIVPSLSLISISKNGSKDIMFPFRGNRISIGHNVCVCAV